MSIKHIDSTLVRTRDRRECETVRRIKAKRDALFAEQRMKLDRERANATVNNLLAETVEQLEQEMGMMFHMEF